MAETGSRTGLDGGTGGRLRGDLRGRVATRILLQEGREARNLDGGYRTWSAAGGAGTRDDAAAPSMKEE
ncbi:hypothetical protein B6G06_01880 [Actinomyces gaoshouyii]|nr:hypothetical protein B6G06_01880 [Actinomyces gaoshouyii]